MRKNQGEIKRWRIETGLYEGRKFEGSFLGQIKDHKGYLIYAGPDAKNSLFPNTQSKREAERKANLLCTAANEYSKLNKLKTQVEAFVCSIQDGMTIQKTPKKGSIHKSIPKSKLEMFINNYYKLFGIDLNKS